MTAQTVPSPQPGRAETERRGGTLLGALRQHWRNRMTYRDTLAALRAKEVREREDIGLAGADLEAFARRAAYGTR